MTARRPRLRTALALFLLIAGAPRAFAAAPKRSTDIWLRLDQALFENSNVLQAENKQIGGKVRDLKMTLADDGVHVKGMWKIPIIPDIPFTAIVKFVWVAPNVFEIQVTAAKVWFVNLQVMTALITNAAKTRLNESLQGALTFSSSDNDSGALRATVNMAKLLPALPDLVLTDISTQDKILVLKAGKP